MTTAEKACREAIAAEYEVQSRIAGFQAAHIRGDVAAAERARNEAHAWLDAIMDRREEAITDAKRSTRK